ncbi:MAG: hypothetical protein ABJG56_15775, partial [Lentilitoribacter sp.]
GPPFSFEPCVQRQKDKQWPALIEHEAKRSMPRVWTAPLRKKPFHLGTRISPRNVQLQSKSLAQIEQDRSAPQGVIRRLRMNGLNDHETLEN